MWDIIQNRIGTGDWGFYIVGLFLLSWIGSVAYYKLQRIDRLDDALPRASRFQETVSPS